MYVEGSDDAEDEAVDAERLPQEESLLLSMFVCGEATDNCISLWRPSKRRGCVESEG